ncbi:hypothetical protein RH858_08050 [Halalkaliarchaeum sp. AArc-GB]|uniref:DUF7845 domain-containing protein n=1 Tax=Halalkaliarchaeum sp. AArc-GB TaxID=3074078 RepID=UPI0028573483|nr:hypothetical protein [Halalkaliarchaeum sp. AArc-GB]MDR5673100.1 hypothetical protein [Halalkaliarchaeum sp. AArc-GB]
MSIDAASPAGTPDSDDLPRVEAITTETRSLPEPASHGAAGMFVLNDSCRPASSVDWDAGRGRNLPDGSVYQHARAAAYALDDERVHDSDAEKDRIVLSRDYVIGGAEHAVVMTDSRWRGGKGEGDDYSPWWKYDLTLKPVDGDGEIAWGRTPVEALTLKIQPQYPDLVDSRGQGVETPYGLGSLVHVQATWVDDPYELLEKAQDLLKHALNYDFDSHLVNHDSLRFWKAEAHVRFSKEKLQDMVHTLRQSADLMARHAADLETTGIHEENEWLEAKITSSDWEQLGFPQLNVPILLKIYQSDAGERAEFPFNQPKIEAALLGNPGGEKLHFDRWDAVMQALEEIVLSHLTWADVGVGDLIEDDYFDGAAADPCEWKHPEGRRDWLKQHYESLVPDLYREATKANTTLVYDILDVVRRYGRVNYQTLMDETGAAYRTVREHVTRLCAMGGEEPGILKKIQDVETWVAFSSRYFEEDADEALDQVRPDDTPEDRRERAEERRERRREQRDDENDDDQEEDADDQEGDRADWVSVDRLSWTLSQLARAAEKGHLVDEDVRVNVTPYDWLEPRPG